MRVIEPDAVDVAACPPVLLTLYGYSFAAEHCCGAVRLPGTAAKDRRSTNSSEPDVNQTAMSRG